MESLITPIKDWIARRYDDDQPDVPTFHLGDVTAEIHDVMHDCGHVGHVFYFRMCDPEGDYRCAVSLHEIDAADVAVLLSKCIDHVERNQMECEHE